MSIFGTIMSKLSGYAHAVTDAVGVTQAAAVPSTAPATDVPPMGEVDVEKILNDLAAKHGQPSNWRVSIVDLMKLLDLDSSLTARKQLATELQFTGDMNDSAGMNIWLHKQVMTKLAENGGKVPADLH